MTNPELKKDLAAEAWDESQDRHLLAQLRAIEQPTPSAELDATILNNIEASLHAEVQAKAQTTLATTSDKKAQSHSGTSVATSWLDQLRRWWYLPITALASLLVVVNLQQPESTPSLAMPQLAQAERVNQVQATPVVAQSKGSADLAISPTITDSKRSEIAEQSPPSKPNATNSLSKARSDGSDATTQVAKADARPNKNHSGVISDAERMTSATPAPVLAAPIASAAPKVSEVASATADREILTRQAALQAEKANDVVAEAPKPEPLRRIEVTGSRISMDSKTETSVAFREEALKKNAPEVKMTVAALPPTPEEPHKTIVAAAPIAMPPVPVLAKPIAPAPEVIAPIRPMVDASRQRVVSDEAQSITQELESLLRQKREQDALNLWLEFKKRNPNQALAADLESRLKTIQQGGAKTKESTKEDK